MQYIMRASHHSRHLQLQTTGEFLLPHLSSNISEKSATEPPMRFGCQKHLELELVPLVLGEDRNVLRLCSFL